MVNPNTSAEQAKKGNLKSVIHNVNPPSHFLNNMTLIYIEAMPLKKVPLIQLNSDHLSGVKFLSHGGGFSIIVINVLGLTESHALTLLHTSYNVIATQPSEMDYEDPLTISKPPLLPGFAVPILSEMDCGPMSLHH